MIKFILTLRAAKRKDLRSQVAHQSDSPNGGKTIAGSPKIPRCARDKVDFVSIRRTE